MSTPYKFQPLSTSGLDSKKHMDQHEMTTQQTNLTAHIMLHGILFFAYAGILVASVLLRDESAIIYLHWSSTFHASKPMGIQIEHLSWFYLSISLFENVFSIVPLLAASKSTVHDSAKIRRVQPIRLVSHFLALPVIIVQLSILIGILDILTLAVIGVLSSSLIVLGIAQQYANDKLHELEDRQKRRDEMDGIVDAHHHHHSSSDHHQLQLELETQGGTPLTPVDKQTIKGMQQLGLFTDSIMEMKRVELRFFYLLLIPVILLWCLLWGQYIYFGEHEQYAADRTLAGLRMALDSILFLVYIYLLRRANDPKPMLDKQFFNDRDHGNESIFLLFMAVWKIAAALVVLGFFKYYSKLANEYNAKNLCI